MIEPNGATLIHGDCRAVLKTLEAESVHCCVTSIPYWGLRSYGTEPQVWGGDQIHCKHEWGHQERGRRKDILPSEVSSAGRLGTHDHCTGQNDGGWFCGCCDAWRGELGLEPTPDLFVQHVVEVFQAVWRVLRKDATLWLNIGDCYSADTKWGGSSGGKNEHSGSERRRTHTGLKPKDLVGIPWRVAFALQADGWWLRSAITWCKTGPMPESTRDRCTSATEMLFMLTRAERYFYDAAAIAEPCVSTHGSGNGFKREGRLSFQDDEGARGSDEPWLPGGTRNKRNWWVVSTEPCKDAHFATMPQKLVAPCIMAGTSEAGCCPECGAPWARVVERTGHVNQREPAHVPGNTATKVDITGWAPSTRSTDLWRPTCSHPYTDIELVPGVCLDPFAGSGTTGRVATRLGRRSILIDLKPEYLVIARKRTAQKGLML